MKVAKPAEGLTRKVLRQVERELGVYLDKPVMSARTSRQQFGVYDEDEVHVRDIVATEDFFTEEELENAIADCFREVSR